MAGCIPKASESLAEAIEAACIQATATQEAANWQGWAAIVAGVLTLVAGLFAVWAAIKGTSTALRGVREQIEAQQAMQVKDQHYNTKRDVYLDTTAALYSGMLALGRLADPRISYTEALTDFYNQASNIAKIHVVAPVGVIRKVLTALQALTNAHLMVLDFRQDRDAIRLYEYSEMEIKRLNKLCLAQIAALSEPYQNAAVAVREDLGMDIDPEEYRQLMESAVAAANDAAHRVLSNIGLRKGSETRS